MKKITLIFLFITSISFAQEKEDVQEKQKRYEIKSNTLLLVFVDVLDVSFEYLINEESSFGVGLLYNFTSSYVDNDEGFGSAPRRKFSITPYYRRYFSNKFATGFFVEGFGMLHNYKEGYYDDYNHYRGDTYTNKTKTEVALGISIGKKYVTKKGFVLEIYLGLGRNLFSSNSYIEIVGRGGLSVGYRF